MLRMRIFAAQRTQLVIHCSATAPVSAELHNYFLYMTALHCNDVTASSGRPSCSATADAQGRDSGRPRLRSGPWHVQRRRAAEYPTRLVIYERGECVAALVIQHALHPFAKNIGPRTAMRGYHRFVPCFLKPFPIVLLTW